MHFLIWIMSTNFPLVLAILLGFGILALLVHGDCKERETLEYLESIRRNIKYPLSH
jgi:hypothetical protein